MSASDDDDLRPRRRPRRRARSSDLGQRIARVIWATVILVGAAAIAWLSLETVDELGGGLTAQQATALAVFLIISIGAVAWLDRGAKPDDRTVGAEIAAAATIIGLGYWSWAGFASPAR